MALVNRVTFDPAGASPVVVSEVEAILGLSAAVQRAREPAQVYDGDGDLHLVTGPGPDRVAITLSATGRRVPDLSALTLPGTLVVLVEWPDRTTTTLSLVTQGVRSRSTDMHGHSTGWSLEGVGLVTAGADPLGR
jgi:hypothetical protein